MQIPVPFVYTSARFLSSPYIYSMCCLRSPDILNYSVVLVEHVRRVIVECRPIHGRNLPDQLLKVYGRRELGRSVVVCGGGELSGPLRRMHTAELGRQSLSDLKLPLLQFRTRYLCSHTVYMDSQK
jgi:hypothetical protein